MQMFIFWSRTVMRTADWPFKPRHSSLCRCGCNLQTLSRTSMQLLSINAGRQEASLGGISAPRHRPPPSGAADSLTSRPSETTVRLLLYQINKWNKKKSQNCRICNASTIPPRPISVLLSTPSAAGIEILQHQHYLAESEFGEVQHKYAPSAGEAAGFNPNPKTVPLVPRGQSRVEAEAADPISRDIQLVHRADVGGGA